MLEIIILSIAKATNVDNRTNAKFNSNSFDAKRNTILERKELCSRTESEFAANESLSQIIQESFVSK